MDRDQLHKRVMLLKEEMEAGRLHFAKGIDIADSLLKVRFASDGKVDPASVDARIRALTLAVAFGAKRREVKKIALKESQTEYFSILDQFFGAAFAEMQKHRVTPPMIASDLVSRPKVVEAFADESKEFFDGIREFWDAYAPSVEAHLQDMSALKSVFAGDIFPASDKNLATSVGLYIDTLVLPDPMLRLADLAYVANPKRLLFYAAKHALNALKYKTLALAAVDPPIVVIAPEPSLTQDSYRTVLRMAGEKDLLDHTAILFGRNFSDMAN
jgi:hypothetical protein